MKKLVAICLLILMTVGLCACSTKEPAAAEESGTPVTDLVNRQVNIVPGSYRRIVCIGAGALRMYAYVGDVSLLCGVEDIDNLSLAQRPKMFDGVARPYVLAYSDVFSTLPSCGTGGPNAQTAEAEKILSCGPDLVISEYEDAEKADALQKQLGIPVITLRTGPDGVFSEEFTRSVKLLGTVLGRDERAEELCSYVKAQTEEIRKRVAEIPEEERPSCYVCGLGNYGTTNHLMTSESFLPFEIAGVNNALTGTGTRGTQQIEEEKFVSLGKDMDYVFVDAAAVKNIIPLVQEDPELFDQCRAWQEGRFFLQMAYNAYYTNQELNLCNTWFIAKTVYPERFADIDLTEKMDEITKQFLGKELSSEILACPCSYGGYGQISQDLFR